MIFRKNMLGFSQGQCAFDVPEINSGLTLVNIGGGNASDAALGEENSNERGIVAAWPVLDGECQRVRVVWWWI